MTKESGSVEFKAIGRVHRRERSIEERLQGQPELRERIERLLEVVENAAGDIEKAAEAERRVFQELREMGREALQGWAHRQEEKKRRQCADVPGLQQKEKKSFIGTHDSGESK